MKKRFSIIYQRYALQRRFLLVGGFNTLVAITFYPLLCFSVTFFRHHYLLTLILSHVVCITLSYLTQKYLVFKTHGVSFYEYLRFILFYNGVFVINFLLLPLLVQHFHASPGKIQLGINLLIAIGSYFWHQKITFKS